MNEKAAIFWGLIVLLFAPSIFFEIFTYILPYIIIIGIAATIVKGGKNGITVVCALGAFTSFIQIFLTMIRDGSELYMKIQTAIDLVSLVSIETILDLLLYTQSMSWNTWDHIVATVLFLFGAVLSSKL